ncbi:GIY-YIG nuclease family protein [bacterium]|nr:GIY-YIG nuclease family protein [bacterium]
MQKQYYVYILTNYNNTTFYIGVTDNLLRRLHEHKNKITKGFSAKYNLNKLIYFECTNFIEDALNREKQLKNWHRDWKLNLVKSTNPDFKDLGPEIGYVEIDSETSSE